jgi:hypothetical protein
MKTSSASNQQERTRCQSASGDGGLVSLTAPAPAHPDGLPERKDEDDTTLSREQLATMIRTAMPAVRHCYEKQLKSENEWVPGALQLESLPDGGPKVVIHEKTEHPTVEHCIEEALRRANWKVSPGTSIQYPLNVDPFQ